MVLPALALPLVGAITGTAIVGAGVMTLTDAGEAWNDVWENVIMEQTKTIRDNVCEWIAKVLYFGGVHVFSAPEWIAESIAHAIWPINDPLLVLIEPRDARAERFSEDLLFLPWGSTGASIADWMVISSELVGSTYHWTEVGGLDTEEDSGRIHHSGDINILWYGFTGHFELDNTVVQWVGYHA